MMKKLFLISIVLSVVCSIHAQTESSAPAPTMEQKYNTAKMLLYNNILGLITAARNEGITAEEFGKKGGEAFIPYWDENSDPDQFIGFLVWSWACITNDFQIVEQSDKKVVVTVSSLYQPLEDEGVLYGCSVEEYTAFLHAELKVIADHLGLGFELTRGEEGYKLVVTK